MDFFTEWQLLKQGVPALGAMEVNLLMNSADLNLNMMSEEDFEAYLSSSADNEEVRNHVKRNSIIKCLNKCRDALRRAEEGMSEFVDFVKEDRMFDSSDVSSYLNDIGTELFACREAISGLGIPGKKAAPPDGNKLPPRDVEFKRDGEHLKIIFPTLLPKRYKGDGLDAQFFYFNYNYSNAFYNFFSNGKHIVYDKAAIIYTHVFEDENHLADYDNFETKAITDKITSFILTDDDPRRCSMYFMYRIGEHAHTEVDVIPKRDLVDFIKKYDV